MQLVRNSSLYALLGDNVPTQYRDIIVSGLVLNSEGVSDGHLFVALKGTRVDGADFIPDAAKAGAVAVLIDALYVKDIHCKDLPIISVPNLDQCLGDIAARFFDFPSVQMKVVGITGTNGKTTCATWLSQLYLQLGKKSALIGTLGYGMSGQPLLSTGMTTPNAIECQRIMAELVESSVDAVAMEVSSHSIAQHRISGIEFDVAVFTNLSRDHLDFHGSMEDYAAAKLTFIEDENIPCAVINIDDKYGVDVYQKVKASSREVFSYSIKNVNADVYATDILFHEQGISATVISIWGRADIDFPIIGEFNLSNILAVIAVACAQGESFSKVVAACKILAPVSGRMQAVMVEQSHLQNITAYIDYAHTPDALEKALKTLRQHVNNELWLVFGCGGDRDRGKRPLMGETASLYSDHIVVTSDNPRSEDPSLIVDEILAGVINQEKTVVCPDRKEAIDYAVNTAHSGDCILIAGKGHEDYQIIGEHRYAFDDVHIARLAMQARLAASYGRSAL